ncbi:MAG TPA: hypothetical protein PLQ00_16885 [Thermoguttaceae bacterium]|nr:hypothetical protein [Thermoguttaceae bacterium]
MYVVHLEHNQLIRARLAGLLGAAEGRLGPYQYLDTDVPADVRRLIHANQVQLVILDAALNPAWDNRHLLSVLRHLVVGEELPPGVRLADCTAHAVCVLAFQHHVPCALLTSYLDYTGGDLRISEEKIREVFHVKGVFPKTGGGMERCAHWVRETLKLVPIPSPPTAR